MANQNQLQIIIEAVNKASKELEKVSNDVGKLGGSATKAGKEVGDSSSKLDALKNAAMNAGQSLGLPVSQLGELTNAAGALVPEILAAVAVITLLVKAVQALSRFIRESIPEFTEYEQVMKGLSSVAGAFGESQRTARDEAQSLAEDGLISVTTAANGLKSLLSTGLELDKAVDLMKAYKDEAAFGRASTIEYDDAVRNLAESFKTENAMIGNLSGQVENYSYIIEIGAMKMGKMESELTRAERTQAKYIGTLEVARKAQGDASRYAETYLGQQAKLRMTMKELRIEMGSYLVPVMEALTRWKLRLAQSAKALTPVMKAVAKAFLIVAQGAVQATNAIRGTVSAFVAVHKSINQMSFKPLRDSLSNTANEMVNTWEDFGQAWEGINNVNIENVLRDANAGLGDLEELTSDTAKKMADAWEKYQHSVERATEDYERRLEELAISHREAYESIKEDIESEKELYDERLKDRKDSFEEAMEDIKERHHDKTQSILDDIQDERDAMQEQIDDISGDWNSLIALTQEAGEIRLANLERQLSKEVALGENADQEKIASLEEMIANEKQALDEAEQAQEQAKQDEINEVKDKTNKKIAELEKELEEEKENYQQSVQDKKEAYQEDVENYKEAHEKKLNELEEKLAEEKEIRERHRKLFDEIGDKQMQDDITRLKESHERRLEELEYQYEQQIKSIQDMENKKTNIVKEAEKEQQDAIKETNKELQKGTNLLNNYLERMTHGYSYSEPKSTKPKIPGLWINDYMGGFQHGGIVSKPSIVGEKGYPEVVLPLGEPGRMQQILKSIGSSGTGERKVEQHFHITVRRESDIDMIMEKAAFNMKYK